MHLAIGYKPVLEQSGDLLVLFAFSDNAADATETEVDAKLGGVLQQARATGEFEAKALQTLAVHTLGTLQVARVLVIGLGPAKDFTPDILRRAAGKAAQLAAGFKATHVLMHVGGLSMPADQAAQTATEGVVLGNWRFAGYKKESSPEPDLQVTLAGLPAGQGAEQGMERGRILADAQNLARDLGWRPSNKLYPALLAEAAREHGQRHGLTVEIFDEQKLAELGMGALAGVGQGSVHPPRLAILRYQAPGAAKTLALVGKGITFDSGGISLKPSSGMEEMKYDMMGAAAVLAALCAIADTRPAINVVGLMAIAQNMPSGSAYKPGDVVTAFNGKTIEVTNTDAEGRVALSDAVSYAVHLGVDWIVEASTLTGAAITVLGHEASCLVATDQPLADRVLGASRKTGERIWQLPTYPEYKELYKSDVADINNSPGRDAGTITGGLIIAEFAGDVPFAHVDIAGTAWTKAGPLNAKEGATGVMVRTFVELAHSLAE